MKIYLAGKMDADCGRWRDALLPYRRGRGPAWEICGTIDDSRGWNPGVDIVPLEWPVAPNRLVLGLHHYTGPYRLTWVMSGGPGSDGEPGESGPSDRATGYFHGSIMTGQHGLPDLSDAQRIVNSCADAIMDSDMVFAYLNTPDCYGTLVEIGMARAAGKFTYLVTSANAEWDWTDYWFASMVSSGHDAITRISGQAEEYEAIRGCFGRAMIEYHAAPRAPDRRARRAVPHLIETGYAKLFSEIAQWTSDPRVRSVMKAQLRSLR